MQLLNICHELLLKLSEGLKRFLALLKIKEVSLNGWDLERLLVKGMLLDDHLPGLFLACGELLSLAVLGCYLAIEF